MDREGLQYYKQDNCFPWVEDYPQAQVLLQQQLKTNWAKWLDSIGHTLNPLHNEIFQFYPASYYWCCHHSEWATDIVFQQGEYLKRLMKKLVRYGMLNHSCPDVMQYMGRKLSKSGAVPSRFAGTVRIDLTQRVEGERVKFEMNRNSSKFYDKAYTEVGNVLRAAETTILDVDDFRAYRPKEGGSEEDLQWRPLRKGIADLHRRAEVSQKANERLINALASVDDSRTIQELTALIQQPAEWAGRRARALRPWSEDHALLMAINHGEFLINGFRNRDLQSLLYKLPADSPLQSRQRSAAISRRLRLLRAHGLIQKVPRTHRYHVTGAGRTILAAILTTSHTTLTQLDELKPAA